VSIFEEKYTEFATPRQTCPAGHGAQAAGSEAKGRTCVARALPVALLCLSALLAFAACSRRGQSSLGPLGESGALSTQAIQPAPSGATEGGQVGFFLDVSGSITVRQLGPNGSQQPGAATAANGGEAPAAGAATPADGIPAGQGAPIPPRIGDPIYAPDSIQTGVDSTCKIQFGEGALVELTPGSRIEIPVFPKIAAGGTPPPPVVIVEAGIVLFSVARQASGAALFATTGSAVVATRGADFLVAHPNDHTEIAVGRGAVQVGLSRLSPGAPPLPTKVSAAAPTTPVVSVEAIIKDGVGPSPIDVRAGYEIAVPSAEARGTGGSAAASGAPASIAGSIGGAALAPRPLSAAYRALLFHGDRSAMPGKPLMTPQGGAKPSGSSTGSMVGAAGTPAAAPSGGSSAPPTSVAAGGTPAPATAASAAATGGAAVSGSAPTTTSSSGAIQAGPTPPTAPSAPADPAPPSLRAAE